MAQAAFSVHMDEVLKRKFDRLCQEFGMNASAAINIFARAVVRQRRIPFEIVSSESDVTREETRQAGRDKAGIFGITGTSQKNGVADMSLDDINKEISLA